MQQGEKYLFYFQKKVLLPDDNEYFVLIDPFGTKHLIPTEYYQNYNLKTGEKYLCKVDKINCLGRIFIEPPHPFFTEGKSYAFRYLKTIQKQHKSGNIYTYCIFESKSGEPALVNADNLQLSDNLKQGFHLFKIEKITKGKVFITQK